MELRVERDALVDAVVWGARSLPARPPVQVLLGLLLEAEGGSLAVSGFDYEMSSRTVVDAAADEDGPRDGGATLWGGGGVRNKIKKI
jgi:DNA polymerase-3 subunit beta